MKFLWKSQMYKCRTYGKKASLMCTSENCIKEILPDNMTFTQLEISTLRPNATDSRLCVFAFTDIQCNTTSLHGQDKNSQPKHHGIIWFWNAISKDDLTSLTGDLTLTTNETMCIEITVKEAFQSRSCQCSAESQEAPAPSTQRWSVCAVTVDQGFGHRRHVNNTNNNQKTRS